MEPDPWKQRYLNLQKAFQQKHIECMQAQIRADKLEAQIAKLLREKEAANEAPEARAERELPNRQAGGKARMAKLTPEERSALAKKGNEARQDKRWAEQAADRWANRPAAVLP
jgi:hypothetical protein